MNMPTTKKGHSPYEEELRKSAVERFLRYVVIDTTSKDDAPDIPSTPGQFTLARLLEKELKAFGVKDVRLDKNCYIYATIPASRVPGADKVPPVGFISHVDTSPAVSGNHVKPIVHKNYKGGDIKLPGDKTQILKVAKNVRLKNYLGEEVITSDGTTLLGADDKAGVAAIMATAELLMKHPEISHGPVKIAFTPDEEVGRSSEKFDVPGFGAKYAYTVDGEQEGEVNDETFCAASATVTFTGNNAHPGYAKNIMVNSIYALAHFISLFPPKQRPETTEKRQGYLHPCVIEGKEETSSVRLILREFDEKDLEKRKKLLKQIVAKVQKAFPKVKIDLQITDGYRNMKKILVKVPFLLNFAKDAMKQAGIKTIQLPIRGGTDGSRLSFMGLPCVNLFTGAENVHQRQEWVSGRALGKSALTILNVIQLFLKKAPKGR